METLLIYLSKASIILSIFYVVYHFLLKRDTFFTINRHFFILGILISLFLPFLEFTTITYIENSNFQLLEANSLTPVVVDSVKLANDISGNSISITDQFNWWQIGFILYSIGTLIFLIRFGAQLLSLKKLLSKKESLNNKSFNLIEVEEDISPFSFFNTIVYNPALHSGKELDMILTHEKIHAKQYHTIDLLLANLMVIFQWINPFAWLYKKSLEQNLEFIADQEAINEISSSKEYQLALVNVSSNNYTAITNNFYQSLIKKRINMINKQPSKRKNLLKFGVILPLLSLFLWSFNTKEVIKPQKTSKTTETSIKPQSDSTKTYLGSLSNDITKESTNEELLEFKTFLKKHFNVEFKFSSVRRKNNLITDITLEYKDDFGNQQTLRNHGNNENEFIQPLIFSIKVDKDGKTEEIGFLKPKSTSNSPLIIDNGENNELLSSIGKNPIYIINGKQYPKSELIGKTFLTNSGILLYLGENAISKYGNIAKDGVVVIKNAKPWKSIMTRIDDEYRKNNKQAHLLAITAKSHECVYINFERMR